jgi:hypothetical protein
MRLALIICLMFISISVNGQDSISERCKLIGTEVGAAYTATDYVGLLKIGNWTRQNCRPYMTIDGYPESFAWISNAQRELGFTKESLDTANACIELRYSTIDCHISKTLSLNEMGWEQEFQESKRITMALIKSDIKRTDLHSSVRYSLSEGLKLMRRLK